MTIMKQILVIVFTIWCSISFGQTQTWSAEFDVSGTGVNNVRPRIALLNDNTPIVLWGDDLNNVVYTATWNGNGFNAPVRVHSMSTDVFTSYWAGPEIAASGDTVFIGLKIMPEYEHGVYSVRSVDGGQTYADTVRIDASMDSITRYPTVAIAAGGNPVFAYMKFDENELYAQYHVANSSDGGLTFNPGVNGSVNAGGEVCDCCPANIQVQGDRQVLIFRNNATNLRETWAATSEDAGLTFASAKQVDTTGWVIFACPSTGPDAILKGDQLTTVFMSAASGKAKVYISESDVTAFGIDFLSKLKTTDTVTAQANYARIAGGDDVMAAVWQYTEWGNADILFSLSNSGAATMVDNYDTVHISTAGLQQSPDIAYSDGVFHIVWKDNDSGVVMYRNVTVPYTPDSTGGPDSGVTVIEVERALAVIVSPNPFSESTMVTFNNPEGERFTLRIYDIAGRLHNEVLTNSNSVEIQREELKPGTYFYVLRSVGKEHRGKLIVQ